MPAPGNDVFVQLPADTQDRILHPGKVIDVIGKGILAELEDDLALEPDQEVLVYYSLSRKFVKQAARIGPLPETPSHEGNVLFEQTGEPVLAEDRGAFRVSCVVDGLTISFGGADNCPLVDVSATGFGVISPDEHEIGSIVTATPKYEDLEHTGSVRIQSVAESRNGGFRYGVCCVDKDLERVVQQISMELQRNQLRRLAAQT